MQRVLLNHKEQQYTKTINMKSLLEDGDKTPSDLPEIYLYFGKPDVKELQPALIDTGAQMSIVGYAQLIKMGFTDNQIKPSETYNIRSSTEMVEDCIRGSIKIKTFCLLKSEDDSDYSQFGKISVDFLVAHDKINLNKIILGIPFMHQTNTRLHFHNNKIAMKCILSIK